MPHRIGTRGEVVIPKAIRDRLGLTPGDEVVFVEGGGGLRIVPARSPRSLRGMYRGSSLGADLLADRRADERRDAGREEFFRRA